MKKLILTLGTVVAAAAPVASVIACGNNDEKHVVGVKYDVKSGYDISITVNPGDTAKERTTSYYLKDFTLAEIAKTFEANNKVFFNIYNNYLSATPHIAAMTIDEIVSAFATPKVLHDVFTKDNTATKNLYKIAKVTDGSWEIPEWAPEVQIYYPKA